jgi:uncharacterized SAM-binding protein YcdF (DUF218 family)
MFFLLSKTVGYIALPSNLSMVACVVGLLLMRTRYRINGRRLMAAGVIALAVIGYSPLGNALLRPLEDRFPPWDESRGAPDGIVVLGGAVSPGVSAAHGTPALNEAAERLTAIAALARRYPDAPIVLTGGSGTLLRDVGPEAEVSRGLLESFGVAPSRILIENKSRNTSENARFTKIMVQPAPGTRWLLVTSAAHMPRAMGIFRHEGFSVEAYPVDWRTGTTKDWVLPFESLAAGAARIDAAAREWAGLCAYWIAGRTSALFPGPD